MILITKVTMEQMVSTTTLSSSSSMQRAQILISHNSSNTTSSLLTKQDRSKALTSQGATIEVAAEVVTEANADPTEEEEEVTTSTE